MNAVKDKLAHRLSDHLLDINIRRMRAQIIKRDEFEEKKRLAAEKKKREQIRHRIEFDNDANTTTYDFKGNRIIVNKPREDALPGLNCPRLAIPQKN